MSEPLTDLERCCVHTITTSPWDIDTAVERYAQAGVKGITVWQNAVEGKNLSKIRRRIEAAGLTVVSYCRGGFFPSANAAKRREAIDHNRQMIKEAAELGAPLIVLVCGADPGQSLETNRAQIRDGIAACLDLSTSTGVRLGIEPLHPMYAGDRSAINTMRQANSMCRELGSPQVGIAADVYHLWWDPDLQTEIKEAGKEGRLFSFHVCDWRTPTVDLLNDRGLMGEGCIPISQIRGWVEETGFRGFNEVEIFSNRWWAEDQDKFLQAITQAYLEKT